MKIFTSWQGPLALLHSNQQLKQEQFTLYLKNQRILKRIALRLNKTHYGSIQDSLFVCAISLEKRMPKIEGLALTVPFPQIDSAEEILLDLSKHIK